MKKKPVNNLIFFVVRGKITDQNGAPRPGLIVKASARNIGINDELLSQAITDSEGNYFISCTVVKVAGNTTVNLIISVYQNAILLQSSDVIFNAAQQTTKDFVIPVTADPQFEIIEIKIKPLLRK